MGQKCQRYCGHECGSRRSRWRETESTVLGITGGGLREGLP